MSPITFLAFIVRVLSLYVFIRSTQGVIYYCGLYFHRLGVDLSLPDAATLIMFVSTLVGVVVAVVMWNYPEAIAKILSPKGFESAGTINLDAKMLEVAGFTIIGVYILSWAVPDLFYNFWRLQLINENADGYSLPSSEISETWAAILTTVLEIIIGVVLCLYPGNLQALVHKLRGRT